jgi:hypothetical protein
MHKEKKMLIIPLAKSDGFLAMGNMETIISEGNLEWGLQSLTNSPFDCLNKAMGRALLN